MGQARAVTGQIARTAQIGQRVATRVMSAGVFKAKGLTRGVIPIAHPPGTNAMTAAAHVAAQGAPPVQAKAPIKVTLKVDQKALIEDARSKAVAHAAMPAQASARIIAMRHARAPASTTAAAHGRRASPSKAVALASIKVANALPLTGMIAATTDAPPATRILRWTPATNNCRPQPRARTMGACACPSS
jgi:hypothetical protein